MPDAERFAAVVLAAGASTRLGEPKQLIQVEGERLLRRTVRLATEAGCAPVVAVLGFEAERMREALAGTGAQMVENEDWAEGMGSSLRAGMGAVSGVEPASAGVLLLVCDQPRLKVEHLQNLLRTHAAGDAPITASLYDGRTGVPAVFSRGLFPELLKIAGDRGAREVIRRHAGEARRIAWPEGSLDVDTAEDLRRLAQLG